MKTLRAKETLFASFTSETTEIRDTATIESEDSIKALSTMLTRIHTIPTIIVGIVIRVEGPSVIVDPVTQ